MWEIVGGILAIITALGLIIAPLLKLNTNIVKLTCSVDSLKESTDNNKQCTDAISRIVQNHETRITVIEDWRKGAE